MSEFQTSLGEALGDLLASRDGAATFLAVLIGVGCRLAAEAWRTNRWADTALRAAPLLTVLMALPLAVRVPGWVRDVDTVVTLWVAAHRSAGLEVAAAVVTDLSNPFVIATAGLIAAMGLSWRSRSLVTGVVVIGTLGATGAAVAGLKMLVDRPPPQASVQLVVDTDASFPSAHVAGTAALLGMLAVCLRGRAGRAGRASTAMAFGGVFLVAATGVYMGAHWLSDVVAGAVVAALCLTVGAAVLAAIRTGHAVPDHP